MIDVDKDVPMPRTRVRQTYPYELMRVGESFWVKGVAVQSMWNTNYRWSKSWGVALWRVWRVRVCACGELSDHS